MDATAVVLDDSEKLLLMRMAGSVGEPKKGSPFWIYLEYNELMLVGKNVSELFDFFLQHKQ